MLMNDTMKKIIIIFAVLFALVACGNKQTEVRTADVVDTDTLSTLRNQIDEIDSQLVDLLAKRMRISCEIGQYKKFHGLNIVQSNRFNEILEKRCAQGNSLGMDSACVKSIFEAIHEESVNQQEAIFNKQCHSEE